MCGIWTLVSVFVKTGTAAPQFVETAFNTLIPDINAIGAFINKQTGNKISYLVNSLIAGSPGATLFLQFSRQSAITLLTLFAAHMLFATNVLSKQGMLLLN